MRPAEPEHGTKAKILIVDDDEMTTLAVRTALEELGQTLVVAHSGRDALRHLLDDDFAVILLDLHMPGMDGYETASLIRARRRTRHIPIVFLTAVFRDDPHLFQAYSAGAVDMVFKPVDPLILRAKVSVFVDLYLKQVAIRQEAELRSRLQEENFRVRTEKLLAEQALRRSEENYRLLVQEIRDYAIIMLDREGYVVNWNIGAARITQYAAEEIVGQHFSRFYTEDDRRQGLPERALEVAAAEGKHESEGWRLRKDGSLFWASDVIDPIRDGQGNLLGFAKITRDITEKRNLEQQLAQAQKMEAVGQLTGGIAHDFNNLLTVILGNLDLISRQAPMSERMQRQLAAIRHAAERGQSLTSQLLAFSRRQHLSPETLDVRELVQGFEPLIRRAIGESARLRIRLDDTPAVCDVDPSQLETTLLNLAVNARDAMPEGGTLTIEVSRVERDMELVTRFPEASPGPWILISVSDTGVGMTDEVAKRAFEPFFTTKEPGKGSGLGLSQVYGFVQQSGGFVSLTSRVGCGTELLIYLPPSSKPATRLSSREQATVSPATRSEVVLLVEDDPDVLALVTQVLTELGYRVVTACDAEGALRILRGDEPIDLLLTDIVMPGGKSGVQLAIEARALRPGIKVMLTTGYSGEALARQWSEAPAFPILCKPFRATELAARLREILSAS